MKSHGEIHSQSVRSEVDLKGIVYAKMKTVSSLTHSHDAPNLYDFFQRALLHFSMQLVSTGAEALTLQRRCRSTIEKDHKTGPQDTNPIFPCRSSEVI